MPLLWLQAALHTLPAPDLNALLRYICQCIPMAATGMPQPPGAGGEAAGRAITDTASTSDGVRRTPLAALHNCALIRL